MNKWRMDTHTSLVFQGMIISILEACVLKFMLEDLCNVFCALCTINLARGTSNDKFLICWKICDELMNGQLLKVLWSQNIILYRFNHMVLFNNLLITDKEFLEGFEKFKQFY